MPANTELLEAASAAAAKAAKVRVTAPIEKRLERAIAKDFRRQGKAFLKALPAWEIEESVREADGPRDWLEAFETSLGNRGPLLAAIEKELPKAWTGGAKESARMLDVAFDLDNPRAVTFLQQHAADLVTAVDDTTRSYIRTTMTHAIDEGWSYSKTATAIRTRYEDFSTQRATLIAVTESAFAYEAGNRAVVDDLEGAGIPIEKQWLTVGDDKVDEDCGANEDQGWIPLAEAFADGSGEPPSHPGCRCTVLYQQVPE